MSFPHVRLLVMLAAASVVAFAACSTGETAAPAKESVRTVAVQALDTLRFAPPSIDVRAGETIRLVVTNAGKIPHEFVLGDEDAQLEHEGQMSQAGAHMEETTTALALKPGETKEATVTFSKGEKILFGCHVPGHFKAGMQGSVTIA